MLCCAAIQNVNNYRNFALLIKLSILSFLQKDDTYTLSKFMGRKKVYRVILIEKT